VVEDPSAKGAIGYLHKGNGGFAVAAAGPGQTQLADEPKPAPQAKRPVYYWEDEHGRQNITDSPPPKDAKNVKTY